VSEGENSTPKIVVGVDGSKNAVAALRWAVDAAGPRHAVVEAINVWQIPALAYGSPGGYPPVDPRDMQRAAEAVVDSALAEIVPGEVKVFSRCAEGYPLDVLRHAADEPDVIATVVGARGHGGLAGLVLGSVSHALSHHLSKPLVIVPATWQPHPAPAQPTIVVGVDGSPGSARALAWAVADAELTGRIVEAVMVWPLPDPVLPAHVPLDAVEGTDHEHSVERTLDLLVADARREGVETRAVVLQGHPAGKLIERAATAELLVVGTRGHSRAHELVTGSVSHATTHQSPVPVVVVPS
jgi:nucleotide-binding universal stress UspA family protein